MATTRLEGWTEEEYREWAKRHPDEARTIERSRIVETRVGMDFREEKKPKIVGYAAVFNSTAEIWPGFFERVAPGAFAKSIKNDDVRALWNHDPNYILGRTKSGTLTLREDSHGLVYEILPPDTTIGRDVTVLIKRGDVSQSSFGFNIVEQSLKYDKENDSVTRTLNEVRLFDVSPVTFPAYESTEVNVRSQERRNAAESGEVIVDGQVEPQRSDEQLHAEWEAIKQAALKPRG